MTVATTEVASIYEVGDVVVVRALEEGVNYSMFLNKHNKDVYLADCMIHAQPATITKLDIKNGEVIGYRLDKGDKGYNYTDEMLIGKVVAIDNVENLEEDSILLITNDESTGVNPLLLGKLATLNNILKRKGEVLQGMFSALGKDDELLSINVDGKNLTISPKHILGVVINPFYDLCDLMEDLEECCKIVKEENDEYVFQGIYNLSPYNLSPLYREIYDEGVLSYMEKLFPDEVFEEEEISSEEVEVVHINGHAQYNIAIDRVVYSDPATILFYTVGDYDENGKFYVPEGSKQRKVIAKAMNGDVYDKQKGYEICIYKMYSRESARRLKELYK